MRSVLGLILDDIQDVDSWLAQIDTFKHAIGFEVNQELDDHVEEIVAIVAWRVNFVADEIELWRDGITAQDATMCFVFANFFYDIVHIGLLDIAKDNIATVEGSRDVRQWMKLRVQISAKQMKNYPSIARNVIRLVWLAECDRVELVVLHAASFSEFSNALHHVLLICRQLQERN